MNCNVFTTVNNTGATASIASCFGSAEDDIWFEFTATSTRHKIVVTTNEDINPVLQVFGGTCGALSPVSCHFTNNGSDYFFIDADLNNLVIGHTYLYRVYGSASNNLRTNISTAIGTYPTALPVSLSAFSVYARQSRHILKWQTESENNNAGFDLQYSRDGVGFVSVDFINSKAADGTSFEVLKYSYDFDISNMEKGIIYYRLKQTDRDARYSYSEVVSATIDVRDAIVIYPNPTSEILYLKPGSFASSKYIIQDITGRTRQQGFVQSNQINVSALAPGNYVLKLLNESKPQVKMFIRK